MRIRRRRIRRMFSFRVFLLLLVGVTVPAQGAYLPFEHFSSENTGKVTIRTAYCSSTNYQDSSKTAELIPSSPISLFPSGRKLKFSSSMFIFYLRPCFPIPRDAVTNGNGDTTTTSCLLYTSPSPRDRQKSRMPSSA